MNFKNILIAAAAAMVAVTPSFARIDDGTVELINAVSASGIIVEIDSQSCIDEPGYHGWYRFSGMRRQLVLCPNGTIDAEDHDTVRHETWHAIQHCVNTARGTSLNMPVQEDHQKLVNLANEILPESTVNGIKSLYPEEHWLIEAEAFMAAEVFNADELTDIFNDACVY